MFSKILSVLRRRYSSVGMLAIMQTSMASFKTKWNIRELLSTFNCNCESFSIISEPKEETLETQGVFLKSHISESF